LTKYTSVAQQSNIIVGAELIEAYSNAIKGKSIAIVANQTSTIGNVHLVDSLYKLGYDIKTIFAPEHGFRGSADAGEHIKNGIDNKTGIPITSLYGKNKKPTKAQLKDIEIVLFDIQDVGVRFYTYISTLHYMMEACAENKIKLIVLDRPNPNGYYIDGPVLDSGFQSFVGMHKVPIVHGLTIAEYAKMVNGEGWLNKKLVCNLMVVPCKNYTHNSRYSLPIPPSPNLRSDAAIQLYPSLGLFEGTVISVGRGTETPFEMIGYPNCSYCTYEFTPKSGYGSKYPKHENTLCKGFKLSEFGLNEIPKQKSLYLNWIIGLYKDAEDKEGFFSNQKFFDLLAGGSTLREQIQDNYSEFQIKNSWNEEIELFKKTRKLYLLYDDFE